MTDSRGSKPPPLGRHWLVDFSRCDRIPECPGDLETMMVAAAEACGATVITSVFHRFDLPTADGQHGLSGVVVIGESHLAVHTWPEHRSVCVDLFTCSESMDAGPGIEHLRRNFAAGDVRSRMTPRGRAAHEPPVPELIVKDVS